jgi:hypothetical protein
MQGKFITVERIEDVLSNFGYGIATPQMLFLRRILRGTNRTGSASRILVYPLSTVGGSVAFATVGSLTATALYQGARGNDVSVIISADLDTETSSPGVYAVFTVETVVDGVVRDRQTVGQYTDADNNTPGTVENLTANAWVTFSGTGALTPTAGIALTGGVTGTVSPTAYSDFLTALDAQAFNTVIYDGTDAVVKSAFADYVKERSYGTGRYCQAVMADYPSADHETVISVKNGVILADGTQMDNTQHTWWVGGATAGARNNESLTYASDPDAITPYPILSVSDMKSAVMEGSFVMFEEFGNVKVLTDGNTFTNFTPEKSGDFRKNRVIRALFSIANDFYEIFSRFFIGQVNNNEEGRDLLKAHVVGNLADKQGNNVIQNFTTDDVEVISGEDADAVVINANVQPIDAVEKIYMTVTVQ